jgi:hypothetical protein
LANVIKTLQPHNVLLIYREEAGHNTNYQDSKAAFEFVFEKLDSSTTPEHTLQSAK